MFEILSLLSYPHPIQRHAVTTIPCRVSARLIPPKTGLIARPDTQSNAINRNQSQSQLWPPAGSRNLQHTAKTTQAP